MGERRYFDAVLATGRFQIGAMEQIEEHTRLPPGTPAATAAASAFRIARRLPFRLHKPLQSTNTSYPDRRIFTDANRSATHSLSRILVPRALIPLHTLHD
jgi:hypothetical protein